MEFGHKARHWLLGRAQLFTVKGTLSVDMDFEGVLKGLTFPKRMGWVAWKLLLEAPPATTMSLQTPDLSAEIPRKGLILSPTVRQSDELWRQGSRPQCGTYHKLLLPCPHPDSDYILTSSPSTPGPPRSSHL